MKIELILDEPGSFRVVRMGSWIHVLDYEDGHGDWYHDSEMPDRIRLVVEDHAA